MRPGESWYLVHSGEGILDSCDAVLELQVSSPTKYRKSKDAFLIGRTSRWEKTFSFLVFDSRQNMCFSMCKGNRIRKVRVE